MQELLKTPVGRLAKAMYDREKKIDHHFTDLVIFNEWDAKNRYKISTNRFKILAKESVKEFDPEGKNKLITEDKFYHPSTKSSRGVRNDQSTAGGLLYNRYIKLRQLLRTYHLLEGTELEPEGECQK